MADNREAEAVDILARSAIACLADEHVHACVAAENPGLTSTAIFAVVDRVQDILDNAVIYPDPEQDVPAARDFIVAKEVAAHG